MRVGMIFPCTLPPGGSTLHVLLLAKALVSQGVQVDLFMNATATELSSHLPFPVDEFDVHEMVAGFHGPLSFDRMRKEVGLLGSIRSDEYDVLHSHFGPHVLGLANALPPVVMTHHGSIVQAGIFGLQPLSVWNLLIEMNVIRSTARDICVTHVVEQEVHRLTGLRGRRKTRTIYNPIDTELFHPSAASSRNIEPTKLLTVGPLTRFRRVELLLRALAIVREFIPEVELCVVGSPTASLHRISRRLKLGNSIRFLGHVPYGDLPEVIGRSAICLTAAPDVARSTLEYMSCGKLVIAGPGPSFQYVLDGGRRGIIARESTARGLSRAILFAVRNFDEVTQRGNRAREWALNETSLRAVGAKHLRVYNNLLSESREH